MGQERSLRMAACVGLMGVVAAATGCASGSHDSAAADMSPSARTYLSKALSIMEKHSLVRREIDWAELRSRAFSQARGAQKTADTYGAIDSALYALGDGHSAFWEPEQAKERFGASPVNLDGLEGRFLKSGVGYISLPGVQGSQDTYDQYVRQGRSAVAKAGADDACGWVVDLRADTGGNMWPMLAVVGPILGDGRVGAFVNADGRESDWSIRHSSPYKDGKSAGWSDGRPLTKSNSPVAVLTGKRTASSGEAVVVAFRGRPDTRFFGEQTSGVPTGNMPYHLSDGAVLFLTEFKDVDRTGRAYDAPIPPDVEIIKDPRAVARNRDEVLQAAESWLLKRGGCRRP
ncbi:S41 family peptidase [Streptomyces pseudovenezuelae]|uniref:S41 family peptidase n=1 Tax=Streptomyces pseudovenezuelae TaxID=67350 RepID=UPI002E8176DA|nr:S41 family peptidase [Streptomyces pseudovenezuelae]